MTRAAVLVIALLACACTGEPPADATCMERARAACGQQCLRYFSLPPIGANAMYVRCIHECARQARQSCEAPG